VDSSFLPRCVALFPNEKKENSLALGRKIQEFFSKRSIKTFAEEEKAHDLGALPLSTLGNQKVDCLISMGGDGTLLRIANRYSHLKAPILGVNLGHLGFMADVPISDLFPSLEELAEGRFTVEKRLVLQASKEGFSPLISVNDLVIHRAQNHSLIELAIYVDDCYVNTFVADGIIVSTPTGSTAYNLAAGGPILSPLLDALALTPICPHTISNRALVLSPDRKISIRYLSPYDPVEVRADGLSALPLSSGQEVTIERSHQFFQLICLERQDYFSTLRTKLGWSGTLRIHKHLKEEL